MSKLSQRCLGYVPLTVETVESFYDGTRSASAERCLLALCESHERLRAELQGAEILLEEDRLKAEAGKQLAEACRRLAACPNIENRGSPWRDVDDAIRGVLAALAAWEKLEVRS